MTTPVQEIKEKLNIVDIVGEYVRLKKAGANHKGLCPFHNESTPSFTVSEPKQFFHCFGCGKGGDIFQFVQEIEGVEFAEALRILAQKAGIELKKQNPKESKERERLLDITDTAAQFFYAQLTQARNAEHARAYLQKRGVTEETIRAFRIGYAPESWSALLDHLRSKGFQEQEVEKAGLAIRSQKGGWYDRFRDRVMFPIENAQGIVVGFTGRVLKADAKEAKYVNTPTTPLYNKSAVLYGLSHAKPFIQKMDAVVLMEGQMDVVGSFQAKIRNVVASSGTALTAEQVALLKRYTNNILLAFDGDAAGIHAAWKGMQLAIVQEMNIKVMALPAGKDPADLALDNPDSIRELAKAAKPFMEYAFSEVLKNKDVSRVQDKKAAAAELLPMIALYPDPIERAHYTQQLAALLSVDESVIQEKIAQVRAVQSSGRRPMIGQQEGPQGSGHGQVAGAQNTASGQSGAPVETPEERTLERLLSILVKYPHSHQYAKAIFPEKLPENLDIQEEARALYKLLLSPYTDGSRVTREPSHSNHTSGSFEARIAMLAEEYYAVLSPEEQEKECRTLLISLKRTSLQRDIRVLQQRIRQAEMTGASRETLEELIQQLASLTAELNPLK